MSGKKLFAEPGKQEIIATRTFNAPRELVFKAATDPKLIPQWWGPGFLTTTIDKQELRPGGMWRFVQRDPEGKEYAFHGVYHSVEPPARFVQTFEWEGMPGHVLLETTTFEEHDGVTTMVEASVFQSVEDRDGMLNMGMESGEVETIERLTKLLEKMKK